MDIREKLKQIIRHYPVTRKYILKLFPVQPNIIPFQVDTSSVMNKPIFIGEALVTSELRNKCLVLNSCYDWEIKIIDKLVVLIPMKKTE